MHDKNKLSTSLIERKGRKMEGFFPPLPFPPLPFISLHFPHILSKQTFPKFLVNRLNPIFPYFFWCQPIKPPSSIFPRPNLLRYVPNNLFLLIVPFLPFSRADGTCFDIYYIPSSCLAWYICTSCFLHAKSHLHYLFNHQPSHSLRLVCLLYVHIKVTLNDQFM